MAKPSMRYQWVTRASDDYILDWQRALETMPSPSVINHADLLVKESLEFHGDVLDHRRQMNALELDRRTSQRAKTAPYDALNQLSDYGFAWRDIARILNVTVPAITKWRKGAGTTGQHRLRLARLLALIDMMRARSVNEPASWLEMPLLDGVSLTGLDLLTKGRDDLVVELAGAHPGDRTAEAVLDEFDPEWRSTLVDSQFESFVANDGSISIRFKQGANE